MLLINGQRITVSNCREFGRVQSPMYFQMENRLLGNVGLGFGALASIPVAHGMDGILPCITAGSMTSRAVKFLTIDGVAPINQGISIAASGSAITFDGAAPLAALVNMAASGPVVFGGSADIYGVAYMTSTGNVVFAGSAGLGGQFSIDASGALTFGGSAVTHSLAYLETTEQTGTMTEATISAAVWAAQDAETILKLLGARVSRSLDTITIYEDDGVTPWRQYDLANGGRERL
jgi:hypothetical protein